MCPMIALSCVKLIFCFYWYIVIVGVCALYYLIAYWSALIIFHPIHICIYPFTVVVVLKFQLIKNWGKGKKENENNDLLSGLDWMDDETVECVI